jgi:PKD repeat protein
MSTRWSRSSLRRLLAGLAPGLLALMLLAGAAPASASQLLYYGGPVVHSANVVLVKWGGNVRASYASATSGDPALFRYLADQSGSTSDIGGVLAQYMDSTGHNSENRFSFTGTTQIDPAVGAVPPATVQDTAIQTQLANDISSGALPAPSGNGLSTVYVVLFPPGDNVCMDGSCGYDPNGGFCAYHGSFQLPGSSSHVLYEAMPDNGPGTANSGYCGPSSSDLANQTSVVSHETAETVNDPLVAEAPGWGAPLGWYDPTYNGEIADKCDAQPLVSNGSWKVEPLWSNLDHACEGAESAFSAPTASFLASSTASPGQPLSFDASSSTDPAQNHTAALEQGLGSTFSIRSGIVSYLWNWGDGTSNDTSGGASATHTFASDGTYQVSLTVTDALGFTSTVTHPVSVSIGGYQAPTASTGAATGIDDQGATLAGTINPENQPVSYQFAYGTSPDSLTHTTPLSSGPAGQTAMPVSATVSGLASSTIYYYQLVVTTGGQSYSGGVESFATSASTLPSQTPVVATGSAARIGSSGALLTGTINPDGPAAVTYDFAYGTSPAKLSRSTAQTPLGGRTTAAPVNATLTGLLAHTTYYFRLDVTLDGTTYSGKVHSFRTRSPAPGVRTGRARGITSTTAVVSGSVNPHGTPTAYLVEFGSRLAYGHSTAAITAGDGSSRQQVTIVVTGLRPHTTYHYRLLAESPGASAVGSSRTFTTARAAAPAPSFHFRAPRRVSLHALATHRLKIHFSCSKACTAHFVLTAVPVGLVRVAALPLTIGKAQARLSRRGSAITTLRLVTRARARARASTKGDVRVLLLGYAMSRHSAASAPQETTIRLT